MEYAGKQIELYSCISYTLPLGQNTITNRITSLIEYEIYKTCSKPGQSFLHPLLLSLQTISKNPISCLVVVNVFSTYDRIFLSAELLNRFKQNFFFEDMPYLCRDNLILVRIDSVQYQLQIKLKLKTSNTFKRAIVQKSSRRHKVRTSLIL